MATIIQSTNKRFAVAFADRMAVIVYPTAWQAPDFEEFVELMKQEYFRRVAAKCDPLATLVYIAGQMPSATERGLLAKLQPPKDNPPMRLALLSDNVLMRGVLTAVNWMSNKP